MVKDTKKPTETKPVEKVTTPTKVESRALVVKIQKEVTAQLASPEVMNALITTTFKEFTPVMVKTAITEGMMRGFDFKSFLNKDVYALKYGGGYSLVTSIDYSRKIGMRSGIVGKSAPTFTYKADGTVESCTITVRKSVGTMIGDFTDTVYFDEYTTGKNQWLTRPRTMIAKVAEMHALRQACPEELGKAYVEEEFQKDEAVSVDVEVLSDENRIVFTEKLESAKTVEELKNFYADLPVIAKRELRPLADELKAKLTPPTDESSKI